MIIAYVIEGQSEYKMQFKSTAAAVKWAKAKVKERKNNSEVLNRYGNRFTPIGLSVKFEAA